MNDRKDLSIRLAVSVLMLALAMAVPAGAVTRYVPSPYPTIQGAINASAVTGDEIEVAPGTYNEAINFNGKAIRLYSSGGKEVTTIDAYGLSSSVVKCNTGEDANTVLEGFTITGGNTSSYGGGMNNRNNSSPTVTDCTFSGNEAERGGGMYNGESSSPTVTNCIFSENTASQHGGGMCNQNSSSPTVTNCTFTNNSSVHWGGGMYNDMDSHSTVTNCTFIGNISDTGGGGIGNFSSSPTVINCTFSSNNSPDGGGMCNNGSSNPTVTNCILWGDIGGEIVDNYIYSTIITYSDIQGGWGGTGNIDADPCFVDSVAGNLRLLYDSPCIDAGDNSAPNLPATDIAGNPRILGVTVDMGAYEFQPIHNITKDRWYETIQGAIDDASIDDEIEVGPGIYYESINFNGKAVRLYSSGGPEATIIDGTGNYHVIQCISGEDANTILEGFTITGGNANGPDPNDKRGGGMLNISSSPTVTGCNFSGNSAVDGGGMYNLTNSNPTVASCSFASNSVVYSGGGMYNYQSSPIVADCTFSQTTAGTGGGMVNVDGSNPEVTNCTFSGNTATSNVWGGGGMCNLVNSSPRVINCTFTDNTATYDGGGMANYDNSSPMVTNCNFIVNSADVLGGGIYNFDYSSPTVSNCTFSVNMASEGGGMFNRNSCSPTVTNCTFSSNLANGGIGGGMYNLNWSSPAVTNCTFSGNWAATNGGGMDSRVGSNPTLTNCTFSQNTADTSGGGMFNYQSSPTVTNCILWNDAPDEIFNDTSTPIVSYSDVEGGYAGTGNIDADPCFFEYTAQQVWSDNFDSYSLGSINGVGGWQGWNNDPNSAGSVDDSHSLSAPHSQFISPGTDSVHTYAGYTTGQLTYTAYQYISSDSSGITYFIMLNEYNDYGPYSWSVQLNFDTSFGLLNDNMASGDENVAIIFDQWVPIVVNVNLATNVYEIFYGATLVSTYELPGGPKTLEAVDLYSPLDSNVSVWYDDMSLVCNIITTSLALESDSPCIDAGNNSAPGLSATDLAGNGRLYDGDGDGSTIVDMGAYEFGSLKLLAHWRLDESSGEVAYDSISDNHGTLEPGPPVWQPAGGQIGGALEFDGLNDFVSIPNESNFDVTERLTIAAWIKVAAFNRSWQAIVTKGNSAWRIQRDAQNNALEFACTGLDVQGSTVGNILGSVNVNDGQWHHVAGVYDGTKIYLYVDGAVDNDEPASGTISTNDYPVMIGENAENLGRFWNGLMDDVAIFSRALDGTEIIDLKNNGGASFLADPNLKALWKLDESSGDTASDSSGGNHGTLEPAPTPPVWQPTGGQLGGALEFDGVEDFVSIPNESRFDITYQLTVSAWIQVAAFDKDWQAIVTKGDAAWRLQRLEDTNSIAFHCNISPHWGAEGSIDVDDGQWHHVAGVYDGTRAYLYVDGVLDNSEPAFGLIYKNDFPVMIGENAERPERCWNGLIDDVRIYTCALSPSEVYMLYSNICYVDADATGNNNGSSWTDAFNYLQDALAEQAINGWEIHVAEGTYKPDATSINPSGTGDREATFQLINGVILKGGYAGFGQPDPNAIDCDLYETTLSGDINTPADANDNSYHVVTSSGCDLNTVLEGFTITGGNASGTTPDERGGGMVNYDNSSPTVTNCIFRGNSAVTKGGGMHNDWSSPTVTDCNFSANWAGSGGGMHTDWRNPTVTNCTFSGNSSTYGGGGMNNNICSPTVTNCTFIDNEAGGNGGGMHNNNTGSPTVTNCKFSGNSAANAGGMYNNVSSPTVTDCTFSDNTAGNHAGGMYNNNSSTVTSCIFTGNTSSAGGGMFNGGGSPAVTNCIFSGNSASYGAGIWNYGSSPTLTNCTFSTNAGSVGGGMYNEAGSNATVTNCIFWGDTLNEIIDSASSPIVTYSNVQGGYTGTGNIDADPFFVDAAAGNLRLSPGSPCIDAGDNSAPNLEPNDLDGHPRIIDGDCDDIDVVDMGAYEFALAYFGDFDNNCSVNFFDFSIFGRALMTQEGDADYDPACDISYPPDNLIDWRDAAVLCENWLAIP